MNGFKAKKNFLRGWKSASLEAFAATQAMPKKGLNKSTIELTKKESKYLKELINDTGGGKFKAEILEEVPSLLVKNNKRY